MTYLWRDILVPRQSDSEENKRTTSAVKKFLIHTIFIRILRHVAAVTVPDDPSDIYIYIYIYIPLKALRPMKQCNQDIFQHQLACSARYSAE